MDFAALAASWSTEIGFGCSGSGGCGFGVLWHLRRQLFFGPLELTIAALVLAVAFLGHRQIFGFSSSFPSVSGAAALLGVV